MERFTGLTWGVGLCAVLLLGSVHAGPQEADALRERAQAMQREAQQLHEQGKHEAAVQLERAIAELREQAERVGRPSADERARRNEIPVRLRELTEQWLEAAVSGRLEVAEQRMQELQEAALQAGERAEEVIRRQGALAERRIQELREQGKPEVAERLTAQLMQLIQPSQREAAKRQPDRAEGIARQAEEQRALAATLAKRIEVLERKLGELRERNQHDLAETVADNIRQAVKEREQAERNLSNLERFAAPRERERGQREERRPDEERRGIMERRAAEQREMQQREREQQERREAEMREREQQERREAEMREREQQERREAEMREREQQERREAEMREREQQDRREAEMREREEQERREAEMREREERERREAEMREREERERNEAGRREREQQERHEAEMRERERREGGPGPEEREKTDRRIHHLRVAAENLGAIGMQDLAERLNREAEELEAHLRQGPPGGDEVHGGIMEGIHKEFRAIHQRLDELTKRLDQIQEMIQRAHR